MEDDRVGASTADDPSANLAFSLEEQISGGYGQVEGDYAPRVFQQEMLQYALKENIVFYAPTGSGKTHVAAMLISYLLAQERDPEAAHKIIAFLVPTVALVQQQSMYISKHTEASVAFYRGDMGVDYWNRRRWQKELNDADVVVMTPQILFDCLNHSHWKMENIRCLIFDEAHHAIKSNPYARIMREHYHALYPVDLRPRILGLTAAPVTSAAGTKKLIQQLEKTLSARVMTVKTAEGATDLAMVSRRPNERIVIYEPEPEPEGILVPYRLGAEDDENADYPPFAPSTVTRWTRVTRSPFETMLLANRLTASIIGYKTLESIRMTRRTLGSLAADIHIREWLLGRIHRATIPRIHGGRHELSEEALHALEALVTKFDHLLDYQIAAGSIVSEKYRKLVEVLIEHHGEVTEREQSFIGIIFVQKRAEAIALATLLGMTPQLQDIIRAAPLIGHGVGEDGMIPKQQEQTVQKLRDEKLNLLVATSVGEEGLDFPECSLVVRFDASPNIQSHIQSRGRARRVDSVLVYLVERGSKEEVMAGQYDPQESSMYRMLEDREIAGIEQDEVSFNFEGPRFAIPSTGAVLTYSNSTTLLSMVHSVLPRDEATIAPKPDFDVMSLGSSNYIVTVRLPLTIEGLNSDERLIEGETMPSKRLAKASAAFKACQKLYEIGQLNDFLLPRRIGNSIRYNIDAEERVVTFERQMNDSMAFEQENMFGSMRYPESPTTPLYLHRISLTRKSGTANTLGLICARPLSIPEPFVLYGDQSDDPEWTLSLGRPIELDWSEAERERQIPRLIDITRYAVRVALNSKWREGPLLQYFVPMLPDRDEINWARVSMPHAPIPLDETAPFGMIVVTPDLRATDTRVATLDYFQHSRILDKIEPLITSDGVQRPHPSTIGFKTYEENFSSKRMNESLTTDARIVALKPVADDKNRLNAPRIALPDKYIRQRRAMPIGLCRESYLDIGFWDTISTMPSWLRGIEDRVHAQKMIAALKLPPIPLDLLIKATTLPACQIGFDYETLETLGDSFLKGATTIHLYTKYPDKTEGQMTYARHNSISNRFLRNTAKEIKLHHHTIARPFRTTNWNALVQRSTKLSDDWSRLQHHFTPHSLADQMESVLGAAWLSGGIPRAMQCGTALKMLFGGTSPWHERFPDPGPPSPTEGHLLGIEKRIAYRFYDSRHLTTAMTHRSAVTTTFSSERLEFLGDAIVDTYVTIRFFNKHPHIGPGMLTRARQCLVSNGMLGWLAITQLDLHKYIVHDAPLLYEAMDKAVQESKNSPIEHMDRHSWLLEMPKPLADAFEALIGAVFVDTRGDLERVYELLDRIYKPLIAVMNDDIEPDPPSKIRLMWDRFNCAELRFDVRERKETDPVETVISVHGHELARSVHYGAVSVSKARASQRAIDAIEELGGIDVVAKSFCTCTRQNRADDAWLDHCRHFRELWKALTPEEEAAFAQAQLEREAVQAEESTPEPESEEEDYEIEEGEDEDEDEEPDEELFITPVDFQDESSWLAGKVEQLNLEVESMAAQDEEIAKLRARVGLPPPPAVQSPTKAVPAVSWLDNED